MKIENLKIKNFKAIKSLEYAPKNKIAVLCAPNGTGKTSFLEAVRFGLTGDSPDNCVNDDAEETTVSIVLDDELYFSRTKSNSKPTKVRVNGKATTAKNLETAIQDKTGVSKDAMRVTTSQDVLSAMKPEDLGTFLMSYVPEEVDFDSMIKYIPGLTPQAQAVLATYFPLMPIKFGLDTVENAYKCIFEARMITKKEKEGKDAKVNPLALEDPAKPLADVERDEKEILFKEGAQASAKAAVELYDAAVLTRKKAEESLVALQKQIDSISATKPNEETLKEIIAVKNVCNKTISDAQNMIALIKANLETFNHTLKTLDKPVCPISEKLICTTDKTAVKEELLELIAANEEGIILQEAIIEKATAQLRDLQKEEDAWMDNSRAYAQKTALVGRYVVEKKNLPELPIRPAVVGAPIDYSVRKKEIKEEKEYCIAYQNNVRLMRESEILREKYEVLNFLCKALEPKGAVMSGITASYLTFFETVINKRADELATGISVRFISENGVNYTIKTATSTTYHPFSDLSHGEQLVAVFLLLDMLNALCGTRLMLLDDINHLDSNSFNTLFDLICSPKLQDDYDHIFLCAAVNTDIEKQMKAASGVDVIF